MNSILIHEGEAKAIIEQLAYLGKQHALAGLATRIQERLDEGATQQAGALREAAGSLHGEDGKIEIDGNAPISPSELGSYVNAWVWVPWECIPKALRPSEFQEDE